MKQRRQYLTDLERGRIRADIYGNSNYSAEKDGKIKFFSKYCEGEDVLDLGA